MFIVENLESKFKQFRLNNVEWKIGNKIFGKYTTVAQYKTCFNELWYL